MAEKEISFEEALKALESITEKLKNNQVSLEESLKLYDKGIRYYKICSKILDEANEKVNIYNNELETFKEA